MSSDLHQSPKFDPRKAINRLGKISVGYQKYPWLLVLYWFISKPKSQLHSSGWMSSLIRGYPCRPDGTIVPWMNYAIVYFLEERLKTDLKLFEFGSGYSTLFYANLVHSVTSVESDERWFTTVKSSIPSNAQLIFQAGDKDGDYCRAAIQTGQLYDVIVVDGIDRVNSVRQSLDALTDRGVILLDDSEREEYAEAFELTAQHEFRALTFEGLKPNDLELRRSTIFYRDNNCLRI
jgi:hypothetical protein